MADEHSGVEPGRLDDGVLPTGTVTFLFTALAGSTQLLRRPPCPRCIRRTQRREHITAAAKA
jgi:hypothetical protein